MTGYKLPQELESAHIIPAVRREYVKFMAAKGMSQKDIAKKLGLTGASVSHYMNEKRATKLVFDKAIMKEIEKAALEIMKGAGPVDETQKICSLLRKDMLLCKISKKMGYAPKNCRACYS